MGRMAAEYVIQTRRFTRKEYDRLIELGIFQPDEPLELIGGQLMISEPQGAYHYGASRRTARAIEAAFGPGWDVRTQGPIGLDDESEPEPDVAVVSGTVDDYLREHPARRVLEVYREPVRDAEAPFGWRYGRREVLDLSMRATPLAAPNAAIRVADLLP